METGFWPSGEIDHISGCRIDNRMRNMRDVTSSDNGKNSALSSINKSGFTGVHWNKRCSKWVANIGVNGKNKYLGSFPDINEAIAARAAANIKFGYHENHGRHK